MQDYNLLDTYEESVGLGSTVRLSQFKIVKISSPLPYYYPVPEQQRQQRLEN
jgi:hypothetical protein